MAKRLAALLALAAGTTLSGCVAAVIPAIAGSTIVGNEMLDDKGKQAALPAPAPVAAATPAPVAAAAPPQPEPSLPERMPIFPPRSVSAPMPPPVPALATRPAPELTSPPVVAPATSSGTLGPLAPYPDPERPLAPGQANFARFVRYTQASARQAAQGTDLPSAILVDSVALDGKRRRCAVGEQLVAVIDLDPASGTFTPPASPEKLPGLALGLALLREAGVEIAWLSELSTTQSGALRQALEQSGLDPRGQDIISLRRDDGDSKDQRRANLAGITCIIAIAGDERPDFDLRFKYLRTPEAGAALETLIGDGWFLIEPLLGQ